MNTCKLCERATCERPKYLIPGTDDWIIGFQGEWNPALGLFCIDHATQIDCQEIPLSFRDDYGRWEDDVAYLPPTDNQIARYLTSHLEALAKRAAKELPLFECEALCMWVFSHIDFNRDDDTQYRCMRFAREKRGGRWVCGMHARKDVKPKYFGDPIQICIGQRLLEQWLTESGS